MKILLIGDYSMVHKNLKDGLEQLGHIVVLTSDGDYWKKLPGYDLPMTPKIQINIDCHTRIGRALLYRVCRFVEPYYVMWCYKKLYKKYKFDTIHMMSADLFDYRYRKKIYEFFVILSNHQLSVAIPGDDCYFYKAWRDGLFRYASLDDNPYEIRRFDESNKRSIIENAAYQYTISHARALIPTNPFELEVPYKGFSNLRKAIPLPVNVDQIQYLENVAKDRIVIYHGISYPTNKGTEYILKALNVIDEKYGDSVKIMTTEQISYGEFINNLKGCHIYIDQCKSYSYGMSAVIAMAMGKVVLSGKEPEILPSLGGLDCPVVNIVPDTNQIVRELEKLIADKCHLIDIGQRGRKFVEDLHDCKFVASKYVEEWGNLYCS